MIKNCVGKGYCKHLICFEPTPEHLDQYKLVCRKHNKEFFVDVEKVSDLYRRNPCKLNAPQVLIDENCEELRNVI